MRINILIFWFFNTLIFTGVLWAITLLTKVFYTNKYFKLKLHFYECGFRALRAANIFYDINFITIMLFLIIYDIEIILFLPGSFYFEYIEASSALLLYLFIVLLVLTLMIDSAYSSLEWQMR